MVKKLVIECMAKEGECPLGVQDTVSGVNFKEFCLLCKYIKLTWRDEDGHRGEDKETGSKG